MKFVVVAIAGYLVAYPALVWMFHDLRRFHRHLWAGYGNPHHWRVALVLAYAAAGWPALIVAWIWRKSATRAELVNAHRRLRDDARQSAVGHGAP